MFISLLVMVSIDKKNINDIKNGILKNTEINNIVYLNKYDNCYIVVDKEYLYLLNSDYEEVSKIMVSMMAKNKDNYDIIYKNKTIMYMDNYMDGDVLIYNYYDIYTYELIETIKLGR